MKENLKSVAQECLNAAYSNKMSFPEIVQTLIQNGFESYHVDFLRGTATYYLASGENFELNTPPHEEDVAINFNPTAVQSAIKEAQKHSEGYTYSKFCKKVMAAGCVGYIVSFPGKRAVYFGRTAETHTELFPS